MKKVERLVAAFVVVSVVLPAAIAGARVVTHRLRLDGYVGPPPEGQREMADLLMRAGRTDVQFQVTDAFVTGGGLLPATIFARIRPFRPNLTLRGSPDMIARVEHAAPGDRLRILGLWREGVRDFSVVSVETPPPTEKPASP